MLIKTSSLKLF